MEKDKELFSKSLPKWPQMIVTGTKVTVEQALEIIRRTDCFFYYPEGNDSEFVHKVKSILKMPDEYEEELRWGSEWGYIQNEYVYTDWICSDFIDGANGWIHPDGIIGYAYNVGKWPSVEELYNEWKTIAEAFPYLEVEVTLMDNEHGEVCFPVVSFLIRNGIVELIDPAERNIHSEFCRNIPKENDHYDNLVRISRNDYSLCEKIPLNVIKEWAEKYL